MKLRDKKVNKSKTKKDHIIAHLAFTQILIYGIPITLLIIGALIYGAIIYGDPACAFKHCVVVNEQK